MGDKSAIEWTDATWNPVRGCSRVSQGCMNCYAERQAIRTASTPGGAYEGLAVQTSQGPKWTGKIRTVPELLQQPIRWAKGRRIFVNSMSDLFHEDVPFEFIDRVFAVMSFTTRHTYQILTKRPARMLEYFKRLELDVVFGFPVQVDPLKVYPEWKPQRGNRGGYDNCGPDWPLRNVWLGVSGENQETADERIPLLLQTPAAVRFISAEPLLGPVEIFSAITGELAHFSGNDYEPGRIDWVIAGGESGPRARPSHPDWFRSLRDQCQAAGVSFFFKQWGEWTPGENVFKDTGTVDTATYWDSRWVMSRENLAREDLHRDDEPDVYRLGKRTAGRLLDGREHSEFPA